MHDESLDDALADLRAALDVEPSPEIAAKVRQRVGGQPGVGWRWNPWARWTIGAVATALPAVGLIVFGMFRAGPKLLVSEATAPRPLIAPLTPAPVNSAGAGSSADVREVHVITARASRANDTPMLTVVRHGDVLVPPDQAIALRQLLFEIRSGRIRVPGETRAPVDADGLLLAPEPVHIPLIHIEPISALSDDDAQERRR
jgi:hypothetical protein